MRKVFMVSTALMILAVALCGCSGVTGDYYVEQYQAGVLVRTFITDDINGLQKGFTYKIYHNDRNKNE